MNFSIIRYVLGYVFCFEAVFLTLPCIVALIYTEKAGFSFLAVLIVCAILGIALIMKKPKNNVFFAKEGLVAVALSWILISFIGSAPFVLSGEISGITNALFESVSGFTTTGASILTDVESLSKSVLFWRSFTNWIGGMGVLVFIIAIMPVAGGRNMHIMKAESPGPSVGKLVPSVRKTAMILYTIYLALTLIQIILLVAGKMPLFEAFTTSFSTAGTGGFGVKADSMASYSGYIQTVTTIFMILFGINFNIYYLILIKRFRQATFSEEIRAYIIIIVSAIILITINIQGGFSNIFDALHHAAFQVASIITTTGFATTDFSLWPVFSKTILLTLMFIGGCAGSTAGGIKVSRIVILFKTIKREILRFIHPRSVKVIKFEGKPLDTDVVRAVCVYLATFFFIFAFSLITVSIDGLSFETTFASVTTALNNVGPGLDVTGPMGNFSSFSSLSKFVLIFDMLAGRLELFPILLLFSPGIWKRS